jgi:ubiquitin-protein ligase
MSHAGSSSRLIKRLLKEIATLSEESQDVGIKIYVPDLETGGNLVGTPWKAIMKGPPGTPYAGCVYEIDVTIPPEYPHQPPTMMFINQCWHPNIGVNGHVCIDILKREWSPTLSVLKILLSVQSMLDDPDPTSPLNGEAARMFEDAKLHKTWEAYTKAIQRSAKLRFKLSDALATFDTANKVLIREF